jgi:transposase
VPTIEAEDRRHLHRALRTLRHERTAVVNRIAGLLANHGCRLPARWHRRHQAVEFALPTAGDGAALPPGRSARLQREWAHAQFLAQQIQVLEQERDQALTAARDRATTQVRQLLHLRALGANSTWVFVHEFFGWRHFRNGKEVGAAAGLTPTPFQSGADAREQGISKAGNRHIRAAAIELAWCWLRYQPTSHLTRWYQARFAHAGPRARKIGIVAVARKLLIALWRFLEDGVIPDGARLKPV